MQLENAQWTAFLASVFTLESSSSSKDAKAADDSGAVSQFDLASAGLQDV
jgi:hypothetical protein